MKVISLNIELNRHFSRNIPFILSENPDVLCVQEIYEKDIDFLKSEIGLENVIFAPLYYLPYIQHGNTDENPHQLADHIANGKLDNHKYDLVPVGNAIFTKHKIVQRETFHYLKQPELQIHNSFDRQNAESRNMIMADILIDNRKFRVLNTHFTWSFKGVVTEEQRVDMEVLLEILKPLDQFILCGDFNAPRGTEIFDRLSSVYISNIPENCKTTIDGKYHRAGFLETVVDNIFTTPEYVAKNIKVVDGVSDHMAVVAEL
jgi:endonuclease/exonuclease/phosphatase family metal-dependent hydrolase